MILATKIPQLPVTVPDISRRRLTAAANGLRRLPT